MLNFAEGFIIGYLGYSSCDYDRRNPMGKIAIHVSKKIKNHLGEEEYKKSLIYIYYYGLRWCEYIEKHCVKGAEAAAKFTIEQVQMRDGKRLYIFIGQSLIANGTAYESPYESQGPMQGELDEITG